MKVELKKIVAKNIMSIGNCPIELDLNTKKKTYITGKNGTGKSTLLIEAITFGLFGKPYRRINKPQLVNSINKKDLMVELWLDINGVEYHIRRGIAPAVFEIFKNKEQLQEDATVKDFQDYFEKTILKVSYKTFKQIVVLGTAGFSPFMTLTPAARREVVEDLLDIEMFSTMTTINKEKLSTVNSDLIRVEGGVELLSREAELVEKHANESADKIQTQIQEIQNKITQHHNHIKTSNDSRVQTEALLQKLETAVSDGEWKTTLGTLQKQLGSIGASLAQEKKTLNFFSCNTNCPVCLQSIDESFRLSKVDELNQSIATLTESTTDVSVQIDENNKVKSRDDAINAKVHALTNEITRLETDIRANMIMVKRLQNDAAELGKKTIHDVTSKLAEIHKRLKVASDLRFELLNDKYCRQVVANILKDSGVKAEIINQYIPVINKQINHYLHLMGATYTFELNSEFVESVKTRGKESFSYTSFSQGERYRIDLAILFTWRTLIKLKSGSSFNILVMDEVMDSAADQDGIDALMDIVDALDDNVYIVSHNDKIDSLHFDRKIDVQKIGNFSSISIS